MLHNSHINQCFIKSILISADESSYVVIVSGVSVDYFCSIKGKEPGLKTSETLLKHVQYV